MRRGFGSTRRKLRGSGRRGEVHPRESLDGLPRRDACRLYDVCTCEPDSGALRGGLPDHHPAQHRRLTETPGPCLVRRRTGRVQGSYRGSETSNDLAVLQVDMDARAVLDPPGNRHASSAPRCAAAPGYNLLIGETHVNPWSAALVFRERDTDVSLVAVFSDVGHVTGDQYPLSEAGIKSARACRSVSSPPSKEPRNVLVLSCSAPAGSSTLAAVATGDRSSGALVANNASAVSRSAKHTARRIHSGAAPRRRVAQPTRGPRDRR